MSSETKPMNMFLYLPPERREHLRLRDTVQASVQTLMEVLRGAPRVLPISSGVTDHARYLRSRIQVQVQVRFSSQN